jgi:DNA-binding transcriptional MerR regulator
MDHPASAAQDRDRLVIGRFARLTGLSVGALRHYDELDLLRPRWVDPETGYRSYGRDQLETARTIVRLRDLELPLEEIRAYLGTDDPAERRRILLEHRRRIEARTIRLQGVLHVVGQLAGATTSTTTAKETPPMSAPTLESVGDVDAATHRRLAVALFNHVWTLLERPDRSPAEVDEMIHAAHASRYHWSLAEGALSINLGRGEWQCSRVYAVLGRGEPALWHAKRCLAHAQGDGAEDWDLAAAYESMARASAVAGDPGAAADWKAKAIAALATIADPAEREVIEGDVATLPV